MPPLVASYDYLPENGTHILIIGFDNVSKQLVSFGVYQVRERHVVSIRCVEMTRLDFFGYAFVRFEKLDLLENYVENRITLPQLTGLPASSG